MSHRRVSFRKQFPPEVQEHIIDQLRHDIWSLRSCALTCHAWHVRSRFHLLRAIHVRGHKQLDEICSFLRAHKTLQPLVQSIMIDEDPPLSYVHEWNNPVLPVSGLLCTPLLSQLPNLRCCKLRRGWKAHIVHSVAFHPTILTYLKTRSNIESLHLYQIEFPSPTPLVGLLTSLPGLKHLVLENIAIGPRTLIGAAPIVEFGPAYHRQPVILRSLLARNCDFAHIQAVLPVAGKTLEHLVLEFDPATAYTQDPSHSWERCQAPLAGVSSLEIHFHLSDREDTYEHRIIGCIDSILPAFRPHALQDMKIVFHSTTYRLHRLLPNPASDALLRPLQKTILGLSLRSMTLSFSTTKPERRSVSTAMLVKQSFPALFESDHVAEVTVLSEANLSHECAVRAVKISPDGLWVVSADDDSVILWRTADGSVVKDWNVPLFRGVTFTPESGQLTICSRDRLVVRDLQYPFDIAAEAPVDLSAADCVWSPDRLLCAAGRNDFSGISASIGRNQRRLCLITNSSSGSPRALLSYLGAPFFLMIVVGLSWIWDVYSTAPPRKLLSHGAVVHESAFNPVDSTQVFMVLGDGTIQARDVASGRVLFNLPSPSGQQSIGPWMYRQPLYSSDGRHIATTTGRLCNLETGSDISTLGRLHASRVFWLSFSPDGTHVLSTSPDAPAQLWDLRTGRPVLSLDAHIYWVKAASFSPDGSYIATGYEDGTVRLWNAEDGSCLAIYTEHKYCRWMVRCTFDTYARRFSSEVLEARDDA